jgi:hypothetical protein
MRVIRPNCRVQFTAEDVEFVLEVLGRRAGSADALVRLLADEETRDEILDDETLFRALLERRGCLRVSSHFYFYVLVRQVFRRSDLNNRAVADYVAEVLSAFSESARAECIVPGKGNPLDYFFEMAAALQTADDRTSFLLRAHIGNYSLFLSGVFPERIRFRAETRGSPDLKYYEELGRTHYRLAGEHHLARRYELDQILQTLAERFQATRRALNDMSERLIFIGDQDFPSPSLIGPDKGGSPIS